MRASSEALCNLRIQAPSTVHYCRLMVCGNFDGCSGKSAVLFHFACKRAQLGQGPVIFIRHRLAQNDDAPALPVGIAARDPVLQNIHMRCTLALPFAPSRSGMPEVTRLPSRPSAQTCMVREAFMVPDGFKECYGFALLPTDRYLDTLNDLKKFGACLHLLPDPPAAIVVDDFSRFNMAL